MVINGLKAQHKAYPKKIPKTWVTLNRKNDAVKLIEEERLAVQAYQWTKELATSENAYQKEASNYEDHNYGITRNFLKTALYQPHLKKGFLSLIKARLSILLPQRDDIREKTRTDPLNCPLCNKQRKNDIFGEESELAHILINCETLNEKRDEHLTTIIQKLRRGTQNKHDHS